MPSFSASSRQEGASKRARLLSPVGEGGTFVVEVSLLEPIEAVLVPPLRRGPVGPTATLVLTTFR